MGAAMMMNWISWPLLICARLISYPALWLHRILWRILCVASIPLFAAAVAVAGSGLKVYRTFRSISHTLGHARGRRTSASREAVAASLRRNADRERASAKLAPRKLKPPSSGGQARDSGGAHARESSGAQASVQSSSSSRNGSAGGSNHGSTRSDGSSSRGARKRKPVKSGSSAAATPGAAPAPAASSRAAAPSAPPPLHDEPAAAVAFPLMAVPFPLMAVPPALMAVPMPAVPDDTLRPPPRAALSPVKAPESQRPKPFAPVPAPKATASARKPQVGAAASPGRRPPPHRVLILADHLELPACRAGPLPAALEPADIPAAAAPPSVFAAVPRSAALPAGVPAAQPSAKQRPQSVATSPAPGHLAASVPEEPPPARVCGLHRQTLFPAAAPCPPAPAQGPAASQELFSPFAAVQSQVVGGAQGTAPLLLPASVCSVNGEIAVPAVLVSPFAGVQKQGLGDAEGKAQLSSPASPWSGTGALAAERVGSMALPQQPSADMDSDSEEKPQPQATPQLDYWGTGPPKASSPAQPPAALPPLLPVPETLPRVASMGWSPWGGMPWSAAGGEPHQGLGLSAFGSTASSERLSSLQSGSGTLVPPSLASFSSSAAGGDVFPRPQVLLSSQATASGQPDSAAPLGRAASEEAPPSMHCPITQELMTDPVLTADGFVYERRAIEGWLASGARTSPMTGAPLAHVLLVPDLALRSVLRQEMWRRRTNQV